MVPALTSAAVERYGFTTLVSPAFELERCAEGVELDGDVVVDVGAAAAVDVDVVDALDDGDGSAAIDVVDVDRGR